MMSNGIINAAVLTDDMADALVHAADRVPSWLLEEARFVNLYMEKVLKRDDVIDAEFEDDG